LPRGVSLMKYLVKIIVLMKLSGNDLKHILTQILTVKFMM